MQSHTLPLPCPSYQILGVGVACVDLLIPVDREFLALHVPGEIGGSAPISWPALHHLIKTSGSTPKIVPGGSAANTIRGLAKLGEKCAFFSHVGRDAYGERFSENLQDAGVIGLLAKLPEHPTDQVLSMITPDGERTIRACNHIALDTVPTPEYFHNVQWVYLEARRLNHGPLIERTIQLARMANAKIAINLSSFETVRNYRETILRLLPLVEIAFCNEDEARALTGCSLEQGCFELQKLCPIAVVTQGANGCLVGHRGTVFHSPAFPAKVVDTTGAGDLFASGFLYGYLHGYPLSTSAAIGNRLGSAVVEVVGAEFPEQKWVEIRDFLSEEPLYR